jgi:tetratricopeptide (TPR) repeat protein
MKWKMLLVFLGLTTAVWGQQLPGGANHFERGIELQKAGKLEEAIQEYELALKPGPQFAVLANLGSVYAKLGRYEEAIARYEEALRLAPGQPGVLLNLGLAYYKTGNVEKAWEIFDPLVRADPENRQARILLADCWMQRGDHRQVIGLLKEAAERYPDDLSIAYLLGNAYLRDGQLEQGQKLIDRILRQGESAEAHLLLGLAYVVGRHNQAAMEEFRRASKLNPNLPLAHSSLAMELLRTGDAQRALREYEAELAVNPTEFNANFYVGFLERQNRQYEVASKYLNKALQLRPGDGGVLLQISLIHFQKGEWDQAQSILEKVVKRYPNFAEAHTTLARAYYKKKMLVEGEREQKIGDQLQAEQDQQKVNAEREAISKGVLEPSAEKETNLPPITGGRKP